MMNKSQENVNNIKMKVNYSIIVPTTNVYAQTIFNSSYQSGEGVFSKGAFAKQMGGHSQSPTAKVHGKAAKKTKVKYGC